MNNLLVFCNKLIAGCYRMSDVGTNSVSVCYIKFNIAFAVGIILCQYTWQKVQHMCTQHEKLSGHY